MFKTNELCTFFVLQLQGLSRTRDGLLITEVDLNMCRQIKDKWGFRMTQRLPLYAEALKEAVRPDYQPQVVVDKTA